MGRGLTTALCAEPVIDVEAVENLCNASLQVPTARVYDEWVGSQRLLCV